MALSPCLICQEQTISLLIHFSCEGDLYRIRKGLYAKSRNYNKFELATRIFTPSYVSFETVLAKEGLIFQFHNEIFVASYLSRVICVDQQTYTYRKIKDGVLTNSTGVEHVKETSIASKERAFLDALYLNSDYQLDNSQSLNWVEIFRILPIYNNQRMARKVGSLYKATRDQTS